MKTWRWRWRTLEIEEEWKDEEEQEKEGAEEKHRTTRKKRLQRTWLFMPKLTVLMISSDRQSFP